jgi:hypothetical protein
MEGPLGGNAGDPGAPTINMKNIDGGLPDPAGGGGSGLHPRSKKCVVNLHGYDRQKLIVLTGPTYLRLVMLWRRRLAGLCGIGNSVRHCSGYGYGPVQGGVPSGPPVISWQHLGGGV